MYRDGVVKNGHPIECDAFKSVLYSHKSLLIIHVILKSFHD